MEGLFAISEEGAPHEKVFCYEFAVLLMKVKGNGVFVVLVSVEDVFQHYVSQICAVNALGAKLLGGEDVVYVVVRVDVAEIAIFQSNVCHNDASYTHMEIGSVDVVKLAEYAVSSTVAALPDAKQGVGRIALTDADDVKGTDLVSRIFGLELSVLGGVVVVAMDVLNGDIVDFIAAVVSEGDDRTFDGGGYHVTDDDIVNVAVVILYVMAEFGGVCVDGAECDHVVTRLSKNTLNEDVAATDAQVDTVLIGAMAISKDQKIGNSAALCVDQIDRPVAMLAKLQIFNDEISYVVKENHVVVRYTGIARNRLGGFFRQTVVLATV